MPHSGAVLRWTAEGGCPTWFVLASLRVNKITSSIFVVLLRIPTARKFSAIISRLISQLHRIKQSLFEEAGLWS